MNASFSLLNVCDLITTSRAPQVAVCNDIKILSQFQVSILNSMQAAIVGNCGNWYITFMPINTVDHPPFG